MLEEQYIYANYNGYQYQNVNHHIDIPWHFNHPFKYVSSRGNSVSLGEIRRDSDTAGWNVRFRDALLRRPNDRSWADAAAMTPGSP